MTDKQQEQKSPQNDAVGHSFRITRGDEAEIPAKSTAGDIVKLFSRVPLHRVFFIGFVTVYAVIGYRGNIKTREEFMAFFWAIAFILGMTILVVVFEYFGKKHGLIPLDESEKPPQEKPKTSHEKSPTSFPADTATLS